MSSCPIERLATRYLIVIVIAVTAISVVSVPRGSSWCCINAIWQAAVRHSNDRLQARMTTTINCSFTGITDPDMTSMSNHKVAAT